MGCVVRSIDVDDDPFEDKLEFRPVVRITAKAYWLTWAHIAWTEEITHKNVVELLVNIEESGTRVDDCHTGCIIGHVYPASNETEDGKLPVSACLDIKPICGVGYLLWQVVKVDFGLLIRSGQFESEDRGWELTCFIGRIEEVWNRGGAHPNYPWNGRWETPFLTQIRPTALRSLN